MRAKRITEAAGILLLVLMLAVSGCGLPGRTSGKEKETSKTEVVSASDKDETGSSFFEEATPEETKIPEPEETGEAEASIPEETETPASDESDEAETPLPEEVETPVPETAPEPVSEVSSDDLIILTDPREYYYTDLMADSQVLLQLYDGLVTMDSIGQTADGRELWHFIVGNPEAEKEVFINGTTHAREYLTTQLVMKQMAVYLQHVKDEDAYDGVSYRDMWDQVAIHVVPCVNPDGAALSQLGLSGMNYPETVDAIYEVAALDGVEINDYYLDTWKANTLGTDINRNYDALWEDYIGAGHPSSELYKGEYPGSSAEAAAMIRLTEESHFLRTISYHTQGSIIYWNFYNVENFYEEAYGFAAALSQTTGYPLWDDYTAIDALAYSDWGNYRCGIPSVTIECGYGEPPYMQDQFPAIWEQNKNVWEVTVLSVF